MAEIVKHYVPHLVELHNYSQAHSLQQKQYNWATLNAKVNGYPPNSKVFRKMGFQMTQNDTDAVINCVGEAVERVLRVV
jgi:predicted SprT family Zn-dependent metalloprotease